MTCFTLSAGGLPFLPSRFFVSKTEFYKLLTDQRNRIRSSSFFSAETWTSAFEYNTVQNPLPWTNSALQYLMNLTGSVKPDDIRVVRAITPRILIPFDARTRTSSSTDFHSRILVGIPTVKRLQHEYIDETLQSLLENVGGDEQYVTFVIFISEIHDQSWADALAKRLIRTYAEKIARGVIHIISPSPTFYPDFTKIDVTLNDSVDRVMWRAKQCLDFAYLMM